jgi:predicted site-specific integrase-resolvase
VERYILLKDAAERLGVAYITLWKWAREGRFRVVRLPSGRLAIPVEEFEKLRPPEMRLVDKPRAIIYVRVSSDKQARQGDLDRQVEALKRYAAEHGYQVVEVIRDIGSGLKTNRRGLKKLLRMVVQRRVDVVLVTYRDRLTRFGYEYLEFFFRQYGVKIVEAFKTEKEPLEELIEDFVEIIASFAARIYGRRSHKVKRLVEANLRFLREKGVSLPERFKQV